MLDVQPPLHRDRIRRGASTIVRPFTALTPIVARSVRDALKGSRRSPSTLTVTAALGRELMIELPPAAIETWIPDRIYDGSVVRRLSDAFVDHHDWSGIERPVETDHVFHEMRDLVALRTRFHEGASYCYLMEMAERGVPILRNCVRLDSKVRISSYFESYLPLIDDIERNGYRMQRRRFSRLDEVGVAIGSNGSPRRFLGGRHRFGIVRALNLDRIPAQVKLCHRDWLADLASYRGEPPITALRQWLREHREPRVCRQAFANG